MLRDTFPRYISIPPLVASVGTVHFIEPGSAKINILRPAAFAQRTGKANVRGLRKLALMLEPCIWFRLRLTQLQGGI